MLRNDRVAANALATDATQPGIRTRALARACEEFEAVFLKQVMDSAGSGAQDGGFFGDDTASSTLRHLHSTHLADALVSSGGMGIARMLVDRLSPHLQTQDASPETDTADQSSAGADIR